MSHHIHLEHVGCPLGCPLNDEIVLSGRDLLRDLPGEFTVVKCKSCGLMRTNPRPSTNSMSEYYPDDYGPYVGTRVRHNKPKPPSLIKKWLKPLADRIFNFNTQLLPTLVPGRLLEIGCASGSFMHKMAEQGWQVEGIEFSANAAEAAASNGYRVHAGSLETAPTEKKAFDLIVGWMVLEHLNDPVSGLRLLRECAKPGAWLVLSVPNAGSLQFHLFKNKWYSLHLPNHLYHFTSKSLKKVLCASGWKIENIFHQRVLSDIIASTGYVLQDKGYTQLGGKLIDFPVRSGWGHYIFYPLAWFLSLFGQTGRVTIWAKADS